MRSKRIFLFCCSFERKRYYIILYLSGEEHWESKVKKRDMRMTNEISGMATVLETAVET